MTELSTGKARRLSLPDGTYWQAVGVEMTRDRLIYAIVFAHVIGALGLALLLGQPERLVYLSYASVWLRAVALAVMLYVVVIELPASIRADPARPLARLTARLPELCTPRLAAGGGLVLAVILMMGSFTAVKTMLSELTPYHWDSPFAALDAWLHGGVDPWRRLQPVFGHPLVTRILQINYTGGWMIAVCTIPAVMGASRRLAPLRHRFFLTYLFCWMALGNLAAGVFMSAGPVYYGQVTGDVLRFADQVRYLSFSDGMIHSSYELQRTLWALHEQGRTELGTGISAFPSVHVAMATLFALTGWAINRWLGWAATAFLALILVGSVHLAWHYAVDGYASMIAVAAAWFAIGAWERRTAGT